MKKVLKQQAKELENYVKAKHTQEECIGFIDGFERANELFALYSVSQQRELLTAFLRYGKQRHYTPLTEEQIEALVNDFEGSL